MSVIIHILQVTSTGEEMGKVERPPQGHRLDPKPELSAQIYLAVKALALTIEERISQHVTVLPVSAPYCPLDS